RQRVLVEPGADLPRVPELAPLLVVADENGSEAGTRPRGVGVAGDHELLLADALELEPVLDAAARPVGPVSALGDQPLPAPPARRRRRARPEPRAQAPAPARGRWRSGIARCASRAAHRRPRTRSRPGPRRACARRATRDRRSAPRSGWRASARRTAVPVAAGP